MTQTEHELKCWPEFFSALWSGEKTFELRKNDRGYCVGDVLWLREWRRLRVVDGRTEGEYTGRELRRTVTYLMSGFGLEADYVCMGLAAYEAQERERVATVSECWYCAKPGHVYRNVAGGYNVAMCDDCRDVTKRPESSR